MRLFVIFAAVFGFLGVAAGAFGAHGLEGKLDADALETWELAVRYQMYHAFALLGTAWLGDQVTTAATTVAGWSFVAGIFVFSGTLYLLAVTGIKWLGAITPVGGLALLAGWAALVVAATNL